MLKKMASIFFISAMIIMVADTSFAASNSSSDLIKQGLLGAGAGAVGGAASGAKGGDIWKGALAGAGVNILGGALLDSISGEKVAKEENVERLGPRDAYQGAYQDGFNNGYKAGFTQGFKDGISETRQAK